MIASIAAWLAQDMVQVMVMGITLAPDFFLLSVAMGIVSGPMTQTRMSGWIWFAFIGGTLWDLRWFATPGVGGLVNALASLVVYAAWTRTPVTGRGVFLLAALAGAAHALSGAARFLAWGETGPAAIRMLMIQQLLGVPVLVLMCLVYALKRRSNV